VISLHETKSDEIDFFQKMEMQPHAINYIHHTPLAMHKQNLENPNFIYLSIKKEALILVGYIILVLDNNGTDIEFRRILVDSDHRGIGQEAIALMEKYCKDNFNRKRIWLDVYEDNTRGIHIYEKLGYKYDQNVSEGNRTLRFYSKNI
jgi:diamine N-acetyltransferase